MYLISVTLLMQVSTNSVNAFLTLSFLLFEHGDHALAVLVRTTIDFSQTRGPTVTSVTAKPIFSRVYSKWAGDEPVDIVYPSHLRKEES